MMSREMKVEAMVVKAINEGYEFLDKGMGSYESMLAHKRSEGYDVRCWYTSITKNSRQWIMYGKKKAGCHAAWFKGEGWTEQEYDETIPDLVITDLAQLLA